VEHFNEETLKAGIWAAKVAKTVYLKSLKAFSENLIGAG
jgi:hypothetical protein